MTTCHLTDICFWTYIAICLVSIWGFSLFEWWRRKSGGGSEVYKAIELLYITHLIYYATNAIARWEFLLDPAIRIDTQYERFITTIWWQLRALPNLFILLYITIKMQLRALATLKKVRRFQLEDHNNVQGSDSGR